MSPVFFSVAIALLFSQTSIVSAAICESLLLKVENNDFNTWRSLSEYNSNLKGKLRPYLNKLRGARKVWIDMGAGSASAQIDYLFSAENPATCIAVAYKFPTGLPLSAYKSLRAVKGMQTPESIRQLPLADLITDVMGILTYVDNPEEYLLAYIDRLRPGGKLMVYTYGNDTERFLQTILGSKKMISNSRDPKSVLVFTKI